MVLSDEEGRLPRSSSAYPTFLLSRAMAVWHHKHATGHASLMAISCVVRRKAVRGKLFHPEEKAV